jgi:predicted permease
MTGKRRADCEMRDKLKQMRALRYSLRTLARNPAFSAVIVLLLAFGIGANTLIFTAVDVLLLRDLPVDHPEQLVRLQDIHPNGFRTYQPSFPVNFQALLRERAQSLQDVFFAIDDEVALEVSGRVEVVDVQAVSGNYYGVLGVHPLLGRLIAEDDDRRGTSYPVVLSYACWRREFAGRSNVLGEKVRLRGFPFTIVGVTPRGFNHLSVEGGADIAIPSAAEHLWEGRVDNINQGEIFARVRSGVSIAQASAEVGTLFPGLLDATWPDFARGTSMTAQDQRDYLASEKRNRAVLDPIAHGTSILLRKQFAVAVKVLMGAVGALLLLVCANIAGLMLARGEASKKEIAVRLSLGATRFTIASQLMMDALVLSVLGAAAAMFITRYGGPMLLAFLPARRPINLELIPDASVLAFAAGICVVTALAMSIVPALHLFRADLTALIGRGGPRQRRSYAGIALIALQIALSAMLVAGGGALVRTLHQLRNADPGVDRHNLIVMVIRPSVSVTKFGQPKEVEAEMNQILIEARGLPGVEGVSLASMPQMRGLGPKMSIQPTGTLIRDSDFLNTTFSNVTVGHFENVRMHILAGRDFRPADITTQKPKPAIVSPGFAKRFFPNQDPIGKTFGSGMNITAKADLEIIGVVNDIRFRSMREEAPPMFYTASQGYSGSALYVRTRVPPAPVIAELRTMLASVGPGIAPSEVATMEQDIETSLWQERLIAALASIFAIASAVLVAIGLYGMLAYSIARRTREIGIRMALGARPGHVIEMVSRDILLSVVPGLLIGVSIYAASAKVISPVLYGVRPMDAMSVSIAIGLIAGVAAIAASVPTRRAIAIEPSEALRQE